MTSDAEFLKSIEEMGYLNAELISQKWSSYKLIDGTIIRVTIIPYNITVVNQNTDTYTMGHQNIVSAFVSKDKRFKDKFDPTLINKPLTKSDIDSHDVEYIDNCEEFSTFKLDNGVVIKIKAVVGQIRKFTRVTVSGEPIYSINVNPVLRVIKQ